MICFSIITALECVNDTQDSCEAEYGGYECIPAMISAVVLDVGVECEVLTITMVRNGGENDDCHR